MFLTLLYESYKHTELFLVLYWNTSQHYYTTDNLSWLWETRRSFFFMCTLYIFCVKNTRNTALRPPQPWCLLPWQPFVDLCLASSCCCIFNASIQYQVSVSRIFLWSRSSYLVPILASSHRSNESSQFLSCLVWLALLVYIVSQVTFPKILKPI